MPKLPKVYVDVEPWHLRRRTTDWRYVRYQLPRLVEWQPELVLHMQRSNLVAARAGAKQLAGSVRRRILGAAFASADTYMDSLDARELQNSKCDIVFSHRGFPVNAGAVPVVWQNSILDPEMSLSYTGCSRSDLAPEIETKGALFRRAAVVQVSTAAECRRLGTMFPDIADRFRHVSFFLPDASACPPEALRRHIEPAEVRVLFVGREARRKGLDLLLDARRQLPLSSRKRMRLKIVSTFADGKIPIPNDDSIEVVKHLDHPGLMAEMARAHVLVNAARFESFGLVFLEAMSQGTVPVGPDFEVQRELLDGGRAGIVVPPDPSKLKEQLQFLIDDDAGREALALRARERFLSNYSPTVVARQFVEVFMAASGQCASSERAL